MKMGLLKPKELNTTIKRILAQNDGSRGFNVSNEKEKLGKEKYVVCVYFLRIVNSL